MPQPNLYLHESPNQPSYNPPIRHSQPRNQPTNNLEQYTQYNSPQHTPSTQHPTPPQELHQPSHPESQPHHSEIQPARQISIQPARQLSVPHSTLEQPTLHETVSIEDIEDEISGYIQKINNDIGYYWWKRYIYSAFWSNISTPLNLAIVVLTTLTTGQSATESLISKEIATILGSVTLFISIFNSYFKPYEQLTQNQCILLDWTKLGEEFDEIYYDRVYTPVEKLGRLKNLEKLFKKVSALKRSNDNNYCIDLLYVFIRLICIRKQISWVVIKDIGEIPRQRRLTFSTSTNNTNNTNNTNTNTNTTTREPFLEDSIV